MGSGNWTQVLVHTRITLYQRSHFLHSPRQWLPKITSGFPTPWGSITCHCSVYSISEHRWSELKTLPDSWETQLLCWISRHIKFQMTHPQVWCHPERTDVNWELFGLGVWEVTVETIFHNTHTHTDSYIFIHRLTQICMHTQSQSICRPTYAYTYVHKDADSHIHRDPHIHTQTYIHHTYTCTYTHTYKYT